MQTRYDGRVETRVADQNSTSQIIDILDRYELKRRQLETSDEINSRIEIEVGHAGLVRRIILGLYRAFIFAVLLCIVGCFAILLKSADPVRLSFATTIIVAIITGLGALITALISFGLMTKRPR